MHDPYVKTQSGIYMPTAGTLVNITGTLTRYPAIFLQVGNVVTVSGRFDATITTTATDTSAQLTLPIPQRAGYVHLSTTLYGVCTWGRNTGNNKDAGIVEANAFGVSFYCEGTTIASAGVAYIFYHYTYILA